MAYLNEGVSMVARPVLERFLMSVLALALAPAACGGSDAKGGGGNGGSSSAGIGGPGTGGTGLGGGAGGSGPGVDFTGEHFLISSARLPDAKARAAANSPEWKTLINALENANDRGGPEDFAFAYLMT